MKLFPPRRSAFWFFLVVLSAVSFVAGYHFLTGFPQLLMALAGLLSASLIFFLLSIVIPFLYKYLRRIPASFVLVSIAFIATFWFIESEYFRLPGNVFYLSLGVTIICAVLWEIGWNKLERRFSFFYFLAFFFPILALVGISLYLLLVPGVDKIEEKPPSEFYSSITSRGKPLSLLEKGSFGVEKFLYGSGDDKNRSEYKDSVRFRTESVDASMIIPDWDSVKQEKRSDYLGYDARDLPLNARVYMPVGEGPYPLFLVVHGNHSMIDWSDGGYAYLGEHLASRGIITVSVDENFLNGHWSGDFRGREMPARAWILLKHLELWNNWNEDPDHELNSKVDMDRIILAGHSRGGEAVQIASVYNNLKRFPENGNMEFDFNYNIRGVISIAPTDYRYERQVSMEDVSYLGLQGSYDSDESSFWGMRAYGRLSFSDSTDHFKAGVYIHRANHSQFNSSWGNSDAGIPYAWFLNRASLIPEEDQRDIARYYITGFAEKVFHIAPIPSDLFKNFGPYRSELPEVYLLTHYADSRSRSIIKFGEDPDILTGNRSETIIGKNLLVWKESDLRSRDGQSLQNYGLYLGWYSDSSKMEHEPAFYELSADSILINEPFHSIDITLGAGNFRDLSGSLPDSVELQEPEYDLSIEFVDRLGHKVSLPVSIVKKMAPRLFSEFSKLDEVNSSLGEWEVQTESFHFTKELILKTNPSFDADGLRSIRLVFDQIPYGVIVVDEVGYSVE